MFPRLVGSDEGIVYGSYDFIIRPVDDQKIIGGEPVAVSGHDGGQLPTATLVGPLELRG